MSESLDSKIDGVVKEIRTKFAFLSEDSIDHLILIVNRLAQDAFDEGNLDENFNVESSSPPEDSQSFLTPAVFYILMTLATRDLHGYAIMRSVSRRGLKLGAPTLYRSLQRMVEQGLIQEKIDVPALQNDYRRRYYRITDYGVSVATNESRRLARLVRMAQSRGFK